MTTNDVDINLVGDEELMSVLTGLVYKLQQKTLKKVVGNAAQELVKETRKVVPVRTTNIKRTGYKWHPPGLGRKSISKKLGRSKRSAVYFVGPKGPVGDYSKDPWYLKFWEYGAYGKNRNLKIKGVYEQFLPRLGDQLIKSIRTIMEREMKKARK